MIGTYEEAEMALDGGLPWLDNGTSRVAYLSNGVVYKVNINDAWDDNMVEWNHYTLLKRQYMDPEVALPETYLHQINGKSVIAMEYITGTGVSECWCISDKEPHAENCMSPEIRRLVTKYIDDIGGMNVIVSENRYYIIDLAC